MSGPSGDGSVGPLPWYLLIHQLPPEPLYLRARIRQRLSRVGAVALKNAVYVLPRREECLEDFRRIVDEALAGGGEGFVCEAGFIDARTDAALIEQFRAERRADYEKLDHELLQWMRDERAGLAPRVARARKRLEKIGRIDFFGAPGRRKAERALAEAEARMRRRKPRPKSPSRLAFQGRTWATRRGVQIDRIASAWLIRRFIDPRARFRFVDPKDPPLTGELRFDMAGGDFSHEGDRCTFETLIARTCLEDASLTEIAKIVHDIDLKDGKFTRPEAPGLERLLIGLILSSPRDEARLERGSVLFDQLYRSFQKKAPLLPMEVPK